MPMPALQPMTRTLTYAQWAIVQRALQNEADTSPDSPAAHVLDLLQLEKIGPHSPEFEYLAYRPADLLSEPYPEG